MAETTGLPAELWSQILRICVIELNPAERFNDWPWCELVPTLHKSAAALASVCSTWRDLMLSDPQFKLLRIRYSDVQQDIGHDADDAMPVALLSVNLVEYRMDYHRMLRFAARLQALSVLTCYIDEVIAALKEVSLEHLEFLELGNSGTGNFNVSPTHFSKIRAPLLTKLRFRGVNVFEHDTKDLRSFLRFIQGLNHLRHLILWSFSQNYNGVIQLSRRDPPDLLRSQVVLLTTLELWDRTPHIIVLLRYLNLPNLKTLILRVEDREDTVPSEGWYSPGFDFPKLSLISISRLNPGIARFLSDSLLPELEQLIIGWTSLVRGRYHPIRMPKIVSLSCGLSSREGNVSLLKFWSKCCTESPTSLFLRVEEGYSPADLGVLNRFDLGSPAFKNVRELAIAIDSSAIKKYPNIRKDLDFICGHLNAVDDLRLFFYLEDATHLKFPIPSASRTGMYGYRKYEDILPKLQSLSLFIPDMGPGLSIPAIKKCANVESYVNERSSSGKRLARLVFNRPVAQKALVRLEKYVDQVVVERKGWESIPQRRPFLTTAEDRD